MHKAGLRKTELARRLGWHAPQVDRLLDLRHASKLEQLDQAFHALGKRLVLEVRDAA
jgi:antitoxin HicB